MPVAAIEALVELLSHSQASTISETLTLLQENSEHLKASVPNHISLMAGTDLFQRYLITSLRPGGVNASKFGTVHGTSPAGDFDEIRKHLISNGKLFVARAKESRERIAALGAGLIQEGTTVMTAGGSRVVSSLLKQAASNSAQEGIRFKVIYILDTSLSYQDVEGASIVKDLRNVGIPVAIIPASAAAYSMSLVDLVIVGAEGVVENGGVISRIGTYQLGLLAKVAGKELFVVAESHKLVRLYPLGQFNLPIEQNIVVFREVSDASSGGILEDGDKTPVMHRKEASSYFDFNSGGQVKPVNESVRPETSMEDAVDFTPPELIQAIITETGVLTPSAISEELIKIWF